MKFTIVAVAAASAALANAQLTFDPATNSFQCAGAAANQNFCAGDSLQTNIIIRCVNGTGYPGNCNDNLAGVPPVGVKTFAPCYQTSNTTGDAACSFDGTVYPTDGRAQFRIPGWGSSSSSSSASSTATSSSSSSSGTATTTATYYSPSSSSSSSSVYVAPTSTSTVTLSSTLRTVTGTVTLTTCTTSKSVETPTGTGGNPYPTGNTTSYTTGYPQPTQISGASLVGAGSGMVAGLMAVAAALLL